MISHLRGEALEVGLTHLVVDVAGVGFHVLCSPTTAASVQVGGLVDLFTYLSVREDALTLYGFATPDEREAFLMAQSVTGIGSKLALSVVTHLTASQLRHAILTENLMNLSKVPGVGKKTAARLVLELKDKAASLPATDAEDHEEQPHVREQVVAGLQGLGYSSKDASMAWEAVEEMTSDPAVSVSALMKAALRSLAKG